MLLIVRSGGKVSLLAEGKNFPSASIGYLFWWGWQWLSQMLPTYHSYCAGESLNKFIGHRIHIFISHCDDIFYFHFPMNVQWVFSSFCAHQPECESRHNMGWFIWSVKGWVNNLYVYTDTLIWGTRPVNDAWILGRTHKYLQKCQSIHNLDIFIERVINFRDCYVGQKSISVT